MSAPSIPRRSGRRKRSPPRRRRHPAPGVARRPVVRPVHPGTGPKCHRPRAAAASGAVLADLAEKSLGAVLRDRTEPRPHGPDAGREIGGSVAASSHEQPHAQDEPAARATARSRGSPVGGAGEADGRTRSGHTMGPRPAGRLVAGGREPDAPQDVPRRGHRAHEAGAPDRSVLPAGARRPPAGAAGGPRPVPDQPETPKRGAGARGGTAPARRGGLPRLHHPRHGCLHARALRAGRVRARGEHQDPRGGAR